MTSNFSPFSVESGGSWMPKIKNKKICFKGPLTLRRKLYFLNLFTYSFFFAWKTFRLFLTGWIYCYIYTQKKECPEHVHHRKPYLDKKNTQFQILQSIAICVCFVWIHSKTLQKQTKQKSLLLCITSDPSTRADNTEISQVIFKHTQYDATDTRSTPNEWG